MSSQGRSYNESWSKTPTRNLIQVAEYYYNHPEDLDSPQCAWPGLIFELLERASFGDSVCQHWIDQVHAAPINQDPRGQIIAWYSQNGQGVPADEWLADKLEQACNAEASGEQLVSDQQFAVLVIEIAVGVGRGRRVCRELAERISGETVPAYPEVRDKFRKWLREIAPEDGSDRILAEIWEASRDVES